MKGDTAADYSSHYAYFVAEKPRHVVLSIEPDSIAECRDFLAACNQIGAPLEYKEHFASCIAQHKQD